LLGFGFALKPAFAVIRPLYPNKQSLSNLKTLAGEGGTVPWLLAKLASIPINFVSTTNLNYKEGTVPFLCKKTVSPGTLLRPAFAECFSPQ